jgi:(E)-4-hydroxy-3-methyl-but-2-enyl pyrophosphate reductase
LKVTVAPGSGFCFGVKRALKIAFDAVRKHDGPVATLGPIIHNPQVVARLEEEGLTVVSDLSEIPRGGTLIVRSHGLPGSVLAEAEERGISIVDATCPFVKQTQDAAARLEDEGYTIVIVGEEDHPEVLSVTGNLRGPVTVVAGSSGLDELNVRGKVGVVCQTTQPIEHLKAVVDALLPTVRELRVFNTICAATLERQENALRLAGDVDIMLVVGGKNSANTRRLWELCREAGSDAYHIETAQELEPAWFEGKKEVGVVGGASTPHWIVDEIVDSVESM